MAATAGKKRKEIAQTTRPPVVVVLGHVDHGKTTLLDYIRKTNVVARESGGITQHIGAYQVEHDGKKITFLDTPGHEAFSAIRKRGAAVADIAVLVIAANDGMKPQTREALEAIRAAKIPYLVAFTKIDLPQADVQRAKTQLAEAGVLLEGWGGDVPNLEVSGKTGTGIAELLELLLLVAEVAELKDTVDEPFWGVVIEAHRDSRQGPTATVLVKSGILKVGDVISAGTVVGKVKAMENFLKNSVTEANPAMPVVLLGFNDVPDVGDRVLTFGSEKEAAAAAEKEASRRTFEKILGGQESEATLAVIIRADVVGSLEAIVGELEKLANPYVALHIVSADTGEVSENDIDQAEATRAQIFAFRTKIRGQIALRAERTGVKIHMLAVIYDLTDIVKRALQDTVPPEIIREDLGQVRVLALFRDEGTQQIVGGRVASGIIRKGEFAEVMRDDRLLGRGRLKEVQQNKIPVDEVKQGNECGMLIEIKGSIDIVEGDMLRVFHEERRERKLF